MSKNTWDAVLASSPLNATAATVTGKGYQYTPDVTIANAEWDAPPALGPANRAALGNPSFVDLTGISFGRLTVLGLLAGKSGTWVCRCKCGKYLTRKAKAIRNPNNAGDRCTTCRHVAFLAKSASGNNARRRAESPEARKW